MPCDRRGPQANQAALDRVACQVSAACEKYDKARIDCATAGNFKTCLRIKMGDDERYGRYCTNGYDEGAPPMHSRGILGGTTCDATQLYHLIDLPGSRHSAKKSPGAGTPGQLSLSCPECAIRNMA
jgi:hypothetical protein